MGDTDFGDTVEGSIDRAGSSWTPSTRTLDLQDHQGTSINGFPIQIPEAADDYDDAPLTARVDAVEAFEGALRHIRDIGQESITQGLSNALQLTSLTLPTKDEDQIVRVVVDSEGVKTFALKDLLDKSRVATNTQATSNNAVTITTDGGEVISFALRADGRVWIADDTVGTRHNFTLSIDEVDLAEQARASSQAVWGPDKVGTGTRDGSKFLRDDGAWTDPPTGGGGLNQSGVDARVRALVADEAEQGNTDRWPTSKVPTLTTLGGQTQAQVDARIATEARAGNNTRWPTSKVPTLGNLGGLNQAEVNALIGAGVADPAETGNTARWAKDKLPADILYDDAHKDSVFGAFRGTDTTEDSTTIEVNPGPFAGDPSLATLRSVADGVWVFNEEVGPRQTNVWIAVRVPIAQDAAVQAGLRALDVTESQGVFERYPSSGWTRKGTNVQGTIAYYTQQVADLPSGSRFLVREQEELDLAGDLIDVAQWRRVLGIGGISFDEISQTHNVANAGSHSIPTAPYYFTSFDLDEHPNGVIHVLLDAMLTNVESGNPNFAWYQNRSNATAVDRTRVGSVDIAIRDLLEESEYVANANPAMVSGIEALTWPGYSITTRNGDFVVKLVRNTLQGTKRFGVYVYWLGVSGSFSFHIPYELRVSVSTVGADSLSELGGLTQSEVDARIVAGVQDWARDTTTAIPANKLTNAPSGGGGGTPTLTSVSPAAAVPLTTGGTAGVWTSWTTVVTSGALTAGFAEVEAHVEWIRFDHTIGWRRSGICRNPSGSYPFVRGYRDRWRDGLRP